MNTNEIESMYRLNAMKGRLHYLENAKPAGYSDEFYTPRRIVEPLGRFDLDPCAGPSSHARRNIRRPDCGLAVEWKGRVWMNPPYLHIHEWIDRFMAHGNGICLFNSRTETRWFQRLLEGSDGAFWLRGRVQFETPDGPAKNPPVGSVLIAYGRRNARALASCGLNGLFTRVGLGD